MNAHVGLGIIAYREAGPSRAAPHFEAALQIWGVAWERLPQSGIHLYENRALALFCLGRIDAAMQEFEKARQARRHYDRLDPYRYEILAESGRPPPRLDEALALLDQLPSTDSEGVGQQRRG